MSGTMVAGIDLALKTVLVKAYFTNKRWIPEWIPEVTAQDAARREELSATREPGVNVFENVPMVSAESLRVGLTNNGLRLTGAHYFAKYVPRRQTKWVVVLQFSRATEGVELPRETQEEARSLAKTTWAFCHVWDNPNGLVTVNLVGRQPDSEAQNTVVVRDGHLQVVPVEVEAMAVV